MRVWPRLAVCVTALLALGCDRRETPRAGAGHGLGRPTDACAPIVIDVPPEGDVDALQRAAAAWKRPGMPELALRRNPMTTPFEDGRHQLTFGVPGAHCRLLTQQGPGGLCLAEGQEGVTQLREDREGNAIEADLVLDRALLKRPERLFDVALHEFGHVLGLNHFPLPSGTEDVEISVMSSPAPHGAKAVGAADLRSLVRMYGARCAPR